MTQRTEAERDIERARITAEVDAERRAGALTQSIRERQHDRMLHMASELDHQVRALEAGNAPTGCGECGRPHYPDWNAKQAADAIASAATRLRRAAGHLAA